MSNKVFLKIIVINLSAVFLTACSGISLEGEGEEKKAEISKDFYQSWVNSYEEQGSDGQVVFRPAGSREFPPSRFRMAYKFNTDGTCEYKYLDPADAHRMENCVFTKVGKEVYIYNDAGKLVPELSFTLAAPATKDLLRLTKGIKKPLPKTDKSKDKKVKK